MPRAYAHALAEDRRRRGQVDLTTSLVQAEVNGEQLTSAEIASFFILLVVAGSETTRNAISHGVLALTRHPGQRQRWWNAFDELKGTAVEEIVRWASPVRYMRRTVTQDTELAAPGWQPATRSPCGTRRRTATRQSSPIPTPLTCPAARIRISATAVVASISVSEPTSPVGRSPSPSRSCIAGFPTSWRRRSPHG